MLVKAAPYIRRICVRSFFACAFSCLISGAATGADQPFHIQAHRGAGIARPENTLESFEWSWNIGVTPDIEVAARRVDPERLTRLRLSEADLPNALDNESGTQRRGLHVPDDQPPENWDADEDYQLKRAMDFLRQGTVAERLRARAG